MDLERFRALVSGELSFGLLDASGQRVLGHVGLHAFDPLSATGDLSAFVDPRVDVGPLAVAEGVELFLAYAFASAGLRKVTIEVPTRASDQLVRAIRRHPGITHEGTRCRQVRLGVDLVDLEVYAVWADRWQEDRPTPGAAVGTPTFADLEALVRQVAPDPLPGDGLAGGHHLIDDLGFDSLALLELFDALDGRLGPLGPVAFDDTDRLTLQGVLDACERTRLGIPSDEGLPQVRR